MQTHVPRCPEAAYKENNKLQHLDMAHLAYVRAQGIIDSIVKQPMKAFLSYKYLCLYLI